MPSIVSRRSKPRRGPLRAPEYRQWLVRIGYCEPCLRSGVRQSSNPFTRIIDPAHTENNGLSSKGPDSSCAPLCRMHHREYDAGRHAFQAAYGLNMPGLAKVWWKEWQRFQRDLTRGACRSEAACLHQLHTESAGVALNYVARFEDQFLGNPKWARYGQPCLEAE